MQATRLTAEAAARAALDAAQGGPATAIVLLVSGPHGAGERFLLREDGTEAGSLGDAALDDAARQLAQRVLHSDAPRLETIPARGESAVLFAQAHRAPEALLIVGAGHIAVPLARLGVRLGFRVTVLDDREAFATTERFPPEANVARADFAVDPFAGTVIDAHTYVALVTRGHRWDFDCLLRLVNSDVLPRYIGMIGSRRRVRAAFGALLDAGVPREILARIRAPIGIDIGAETPEEIAVSIAAEFIACRRGHERDALTERERVLERLLPGKERSHGGS